MRVSSGDGSVPVVSESEKPAPTHLTGPVVEQSATLPLSPSAVWTLLTTAEGLSTWYAIGGGAEVEAEPGGAIALWWEQGKVFRGTVGICRAPERFDYRIPQSPDEKLDPETTTLVQFKIDPVEGQPDQAVVTVRESGFTQLERPKDAFTASSIAWIGAFGLLQQVADRLATMTE